MSLDIPRIQALCIDIDGTMSNTDGVYAQKVARLLKPFKWMFKESNEFLFSHWIVKKMETPVSFFYNLPDRLGFDHQVTRFNEWLYNRRIKQENQLHLIIDGVAETIEALGNHFQLASITTRSERRAFNFLNYFDLTDWFEAIASSLTVDRMKPEPDPIFWVAEKLGISAESILMVGDTTLDILAGKRAGAQTVGVLSGFGDERELRAAGADIILPSIADLPKLLLK